MNVFKFGGASIESVGRARNMTELIAGYSDEHLLVVISAKGKTTNALEEVVKEYVQEEQEKAMALFETLKQDHREYASELLGGEDIQLWNRMQELCTEVDWLLNEKPVRSHDYYYDQIVCIGELLSTAILQAYMQSQGISSCWIDIRDVMKTDDQYRDATVLWDKTRERTLQVIGEAFVLHRVVVTQGFIGSTDDNASVTLGREGSDYTAAVLANCLDAAGVTIWKDVPSLLNADPKIFPNTVPIREISFREVIEMAYYGAQVIHPKTIKPLQNKHIPLYVKCFLDKKLPGTVIHELDTAIAYPPIMVLKTNQTLLQVSTRDYSFITEDNLSRIYTLFHDCRIKINMIQNAAISFLACIDTHPEKISMLLGLLQSEYVVKRNENLFLFTVRHYTQHVLDEELKNRTVLLEQKTRTTIQMVVQ